MGVSGSPGRRVPLELKARKKSSGTERSRALVQPCELGTCGISTIKYKVPIAGEGGFHWEYFSGLHGRG